MQQALLLRIVDLNPLVFHPISFLKASLLYVQGVPPAKFGLKLLIASIRDSRCAAFTKVLIGTVAIGQSPCLY